MTDHDLILIGTVHSDLQGGERLMRAYEKIKPDFVTVEAINGLENNYGFRGDIIHCVESYARQNSFDNEQISALRRCMGVWGYEARAGLYLKTQGAPVFFIDHKPDTSIEVPPVPGKKEFKQTEILRPDFLKRCYCTAGTIYNDLIKHQNLDKKAALPVAYSMALSRLSEDDRNNVISMEYETEYTPETEKELAEMELRDAAMDLAIKRVSDRRLGARGMHVGGMAHAFGKYRNLYEELGKWGYFSVERRRLNEF